MPQSTIARIESGARQPSLPFLARILAAVDLEPRIMLEAYDARDDVLDAEDARLTDAQREGATQDLGTGSWRRRSVHTGRPRRTLTAHGRATGNLRHISSQ